MNKRLTTDMADANGLQRSIGPTGFFNIKKMTADFCSAQWVFNSYNLRDSENKLAVPLPRTSYYRNSFCYNRTVLWNNLPSDIRQAKSLTSFRQLLTSNSNTAFLENRF